MDCDDISLTNRLHMQVINTSPKASMQLHTHMCACVLLHQLQALHADTSLQAVGSAVFLKRVWQDGASKGKKKGMAAARLKHLPCHPLALRWSMLFYCAIVHPAAMIRTEVPLTSATAIVICALTQRCHTDVEGSWRLLCNLSTCRGL